MIANFRGYYIHPSQRVKLRVLKSRNGTIFHRIKRVLSKMNFRVFLLFAVCLICGHGDMLYAQNASVSSTTAGPSASYLPLKKCWEYVSDNTGRSTVAVSNGTVYVAENEGRVRALNARTGVVNWITELGGSVTAMLAVPKLGLGVVTSSSALSGETRYMIRILGADSGLVKYSVPVSASGAMYLLLGSPRLVAVDSAGSVFAIDLQSGRLDWELKLSAKLTGPPALSEDTLLVATENKKLSIINLSSGRQIASIATQRPITSLTLRENGMILAGDDRGQVINFRDASGTVWWKFKSGARVGSIFETKDGILVGSFDNFLYMLSKYSGDVKWKRRLDGRITSAPAIMDGRILVASSTEEAAQVLDAENGKQLDLVSFGENRFMLASPFVSEGGIAIFPLVNGVSAYAPSECSAK